MPLPLFNIEIRITAEGGPLARSTALRHPIINKNIRMGGGSEAGKAAGEGEIISTLTPTLSRPHPKTVGSSTAGEGDISNPHCS